MTRSAPGAVVVAGVPISPIHVEGAAAAIVTAGGARNGLAVHLCNAYVIALASRDDTYRDLLAAGDLNVADGVAVAWTLRRAGLGIEGHRPSGTELVEETVRQSLAAGVSHYLYGSTPEVVAGLDRELRHRFPGVSIAGVESPPFRPLTAAEEDRLVERLQRSGAGVVWIGTGTPRQDELVHRLRQRLPLAFVPVGAAFDYLAGSKPRAPRWMRRLGLEWLHRLATEPRRLWRRYLVGNLQYLRVARAAQVVPLCPSIGALDECDRSDAAVRHERGLGRESETPGDR